MDRFWKYFSVFISTRPGVCLPSFERIGAIEILRRLQLRDSNLSKFRATLCVFRLLSAAPRSKGCSLAQALRPRPHHNSSAATQLLMVPNIFLAFLCAAATTEASQFDVQKMLSMIEESSKYLEMIMPDVKNLTDVQQFRGLVGGSVNKMEVLLQKILNLKCPSPWRPYQHMCLLLVQEAKLFKEAQQHCVSNGGVLTWIESEEEHELINDFLDGRTFPHWEWPNYYHVGLHREQEDSPLKWFGSSSSYRGVPLIYDYRLQFSGIIGTTTVEGNRPDYWYFYFLCRRY